MSNIISISGNTLSPSQSGGLARIIPEPVSRLSGVFRSILGAAAQSMGYGGGFSDQMDPGYRELLQMQIEAQKQLMVVSMASNIEKSKHETEMAAVRNIRVG